MTTLAKIQRVLSSRFILLRLAIHAGPGLLPSVLCLMGLIAVLPTGVAVTTGTLVDAIAAATTADNRGTGFGSIAESLVTLASCLAILQVATLVLTPVLRAAELRVDHKLRNRVLARATTIPNLEILEREDTQSDLSHFRTGAIFWMNSSIGAGTLAQLQQAVNYVSLIIPATVLSSYSWWWGPAAFTVAVAVRETDSRAYLKFEQVFREYRSEMRHTHNWREIIASAEYAKEVRIFGLSPWLLDQHNRSHENWSDALLNARRNLALRQTCLFMLTAAACATIFFTVAQRVLAGELPIGSIALTLGTVGAMLASGSNQTSMLIDTALPMAQAAKRLQNIRHSTDPADLVESPRLRAEGCMPPRIGFENVSFSYPGSNHPVLTNVNLEFRPGEVLALVGLNGAGKSTISKLLSGLYRPTGGDIIIDGALLTDIDRSLWARRTYAVHQDFVHYPLSASNNLRVASPTSSPSELYAAAQQTGLSSIIENLPNQWETVLSRGYTNGVDLSGGQWQRLAITRAILACMAGARILILDEPTANLDIEAELKTIELLRKACAGVSILLVSHRFATVQQADRIAVLDQGTIVEIGSHEELLARGGSYAKMFRLQASSFATNQTSREHNASRSHHGGSNFGNEPGSFN